MSALTMVDEAIENWEEKVANNGQDTDKVCPFCNRFDICDICPIAKYAQATGGDINDCCNGLYFKWDENKTTKTAQAVVDHLILVKEFIINDYNLS